jgi:hypothetical protein
LNPIEGYEFSLGAQTRSRDQLLSLSLSVTKASPSCPVLVNPVNNCYQQVVQPKRRSSNNVRRDVFEFTVGV